MKVRSNLGPIVVASVIVLCAGQVAVAQVEWGFRALSVKPGPPGSWDSGRHMVGDVVFDGEFYHMYLVGGRGPNQFDYPWSVGHWTSNDIEGPWDEDPANPVLIPSDSGTWDRFSIIDIAVLYDGTMFRMWYGATGMYQGPIHVGYAINKDGWGDWDKAVDINPLEGLGPGEPGGWDDHGTAPHTVLFDGKTYRMWYTAFLDGTWGTWRVGLATSADGLRWQKHPDPVLEGTGELWEGVNVYCPTVQPYGSSFAIWYAAHDGYTARIGYAISFDCAECMRWRDNPVLAPTPPCEGVDSSAVILEGGTTHGWVSHCNDIYYVTSPLELFFLDDFDTGGTRIRSRVDP